MKILQATLLVNLLLTGVSLTAMAQSNNESRKPVVYEPLRPTQIKIAPPRAFTPQSVNLFDYPEGAVLYVLNKKEIVDKAEFMNRIKLAKSGITANRIVVGLPDANQRRVIEIDYTVR